MEGYIETTKLLSQSAKENFHLFINH